MLTAQQNADLEFLATQLAKLPDESTVAAVRASRKRPLLTRLTSRGLKYSVALLLSELEKRNDALIQTGFDLQKSESLTSDYNKLVLSHERKLKKVAECFDTIIANSQEPLVVAYVKSVAQEMNHV